MRPSEFTHDVFLSHGSKDAAIVRRIAQWLRDDGVRVWFADWEIAPGDNVPAKLESALQAARVLVLCLSQDSMESDWTQLEAGTFRFAIRSIETGVSSP
jgi:hypothetical protein